MPQHASRQRRSKIQDRGVPQTVSQLTAGLTSTSFFTPVQPSPDPPTISATLPNSHPSNDNKQTAPALNPNSSPPTPTAPADLPATPSQSPTSPSVTNAPATHVPSSLLPQASPSSEPPLHVPAANDNMVLAGSALPQNPPISPSPQLSASHEVHNSRKPGPTLSTKTVANDSSSPNYIEALVVVGVIITVLLGGIFYYYFKVHRKKTKADHESPSYGMDDSSFNDVKLRSESISSSSHRIDKKTIVKVKSKTQSIMSFGPGPEPEFPRPPLSSVQTLTDVHHNYLPRLDKNQLSEKYAYDSDKHHDARSKDGSQTTLYSVGDEVSHIPISYHAKASKKPGAPSTLTSEAILKPYPHLMVSKKASPKRYNRISKAARKLVPARLVTGVGIGKSRDDVPPMPTAHDYQYQPSFVPKASKSKPSPNNQHSVYRPDDNYPTNFSYYQS